MEGTRLDRARGHLARLVGFPTVSSDSNLDLIDWVAAFLEGLGARVERSFDETGTKANLFATFGPDTDGGVVLSGHTDVVPADPGEWTTDPFSLSERDGRLYGRGTCDMKGFVACVLTLAQEMTDWPLARPVHIALTYDEETGCLGAQTLVQALAAAPKRPAVAIIGEPTSMKIVNGHKGCFEYATEIRGAEGHGSAPDLGVNAAVMAARYVGRLMELAQDVKARVPADSPFDPPWTTVNIGAISAGSACNVIAGHAHIDWEMRPVTGEDADYIKSEVDSFAQNVLEPEMRAVHPHTGVTRQVVAEVVGLAPKPGCRAVELVTALTGGNAVGVVSFGTEAGLFQGLGMDCVVCGPGSIAQAHKPDEYVEITEIEACLDMLARLRAHVT